MRILILGNSGSGKSFLARTLSQRFGLVHLDLDTLVWEPQEIAQARPVEEVEADLQDFLRAHEAWVVEGCYEGFLAEALRFCTEFLYLNPGLDACLDNTRRRPWEPHKYEREEDQERLLPMLLAWVASHYSREDAWSQTAHQRVFNAYIGAKREITDLGNPWNSDPARAAAAMVSLALEAFSARPEQDQEAEIGDGPGRERADQRLLGLRDGPVLPAEAPGQ